MSHPTPQNVLLTVKQAAAYVPCSESTIKRRVRSGVLPAKTFGASGRKLFIDIEDLRGAMVTCDHGDPTEDERIEAITRAIAEAAPKLTDESKARLAALLS